MSFDLTTLLVAAALLLAAFTKGTTGMGFPLIATPMVTLLLDIRTAIVILIFPNIVMDITQIFRGSLPREILRRFSWLFFFTVGGVFSGDKVFGELAHLGAQPLSGNHGLAFRNNQFLSINLSDVAIG